uniref:Odorant degrading protein 9 n=1 Tax=Holotrichia parallela TaxID=93412 RepID=A0A2P1ERN6_HOLPA|nr:odorant degrading protein 9 [Holotrichia parallela]
MFLLLLVLIPILIVIFWYINYLWHETYLKKYVGPRPLPIFGTALDLRDRKTQIRQFLKYREKFKGDYKLYIGFQPLLMLSEPKSIEAMLSSTTNLKKSKSYTFVKKWLGNGLLLSDGDYWRKHRKIITPAFHFQILDKYVYAFNATSSILVDRLRDKIDQNAFDICPYITLCALDIMCEAAMGTSVNAQMNAESKYVTSVKEIGRIFIERFFSVMQQYEFFYRFTDNYQCEEKAVNILHSYAYNVIDKRKKENENIKSEDDLTSKKKLAFLDLLLFHNSQTNTMTGDELREEVDTLLFEGHDTTSAGMSYTLFNLANHQDVQDKVYQEVESILADNPNREPTCKDLHGMKYLEMVIKESLRLYPPVPMVGRELVEDLRYDDKIVPKGMMVTVDAIGIHHDPNIYPDPYNFDPERFSPENSSGRNPYAFIPFSAGPRNCIGQKFAMLEMKATLTSILRNFRLLPTVPAQNIELQVEAVMKPISVMVRLKKR